MGREASAKFRAAHPGRAKEQNDRFRAKNRIAINARTRELRSGRLEQDRVRNREAMRRSKGLPEPTRPCPDNCELCGRASWLEVKSFALDHDHTTGAFRGWLCRSCNLGIGLLGDNRDSLLRAVTYLERARDA